MSMSTVIAFCLLALPPGDCTGGCFPSHHLPLVGRQVAPSLDAADGWSGDDGDLTDGGELVLTKAFEPPAPRVVLRSLLLLATEPQTFLASSDEPPYWTAVPFGPLAVVVEIPLAGADPTAVEYVTLLLDGKPVENIRYAVDPSLLPLSPADDQSVPRCAFKFPCPPPGKHIVQARYKTVGLWSHLSNPLHFDVRLPAPPQIVALSDFEDTPRPVEKDGMISVTSPLIRIHLANLPATATVIAYLDGRPVRPAAAGECGCRRIMRSLQKEEAKTGCCRAVKLEGSITPGIHTLTVRTVHSSGPCSITSEPSNKVVFHYYDEDVYLLRPGRNCCNRCPPVDGSPECVLPQPSPNASAAPTGSEKTPQPAASPVSVPAEAPAATERSQEAMRTSVPIQQTVFRPSPATADRDPANSLIALVALRQADYRTAAQQLLESAVDFCDSAAAAAATASAAADEASSHARAASEAAKQAGTRLDQAFARRDAAVAASKKFPGASRAAKAAGATMAATRAVDCARTARDNAAAAEARAADAVQAREAALAARTAAELALGQARIWVKEIQQHVTNGNGAGAEAARVRLEAAHAAAGAAANEALKQRDLAARHARSAAAHKEIAESARGETVEQTQPPVEDPHQPETESPPSDVSEPTGESPKDDCWTEWAEQAEKLANDEEMQANARIRAAEAQARCERARAVTDPSSPFYFASAAHFPLPSFGLRGEMIDRGGLIIYEDMKFHFDRDGNYAVRFRATMPDMPVTVQLQFQIQPRHGGPWYTVTLAPMEFKHPDPDAAQRKCTTAGDCSAPLEPSCCGPVRECVCRGHSEILRRCYGEMGQGATIRRTGTARFGFGVDVP